MFLRPKSASEYQAAARDRDGSTSLRGHLSARLGLQGKLVIAFLILTSTALGSSCWMFHWQSRSALTDLLGEHARQMSATLALASGEPMLHGHASDLQQIGEDLIKGRDILFVVFHDASGQVVASANRGAAFHPAAIADPNHDAPTMLHVRCMQSAEFGDFLQVTSPVRDGERSGIEASAPRLIGFVTVGVSETSELAHLRAVNYIILGIGGIVLIVTLPLASWLVHRVFQPIRELVHATRCITGGNLEARVAIHRPDVIGELARSFNEMVQWVKKQRQDLAAANAKLFEANRSLEAKIEQRTAQLETANQRLSSEIAEKEDFLRAVSHDLNAPLRNISGMATMLLMKNKERFDEDVIHRLERIKKNVDVETDLISELLELSRIKTRRQKMEDVNLEALIWELRGLLENDLKSRAIELIIDSQLPMLYCERARIRQVFQNLVDNAIKYMGDGYQREIHIGYNARMTEAEFYVRDTGMGIEPEDIDKVFFVFRRGKSSAVQQIAGKGVGLASVKSIIETYNGKIWVESKVGEGSTFRFTVNGMHLQPGGGGVDRADATGGDPEPPANPSVVPAAA